ncbi:MAG: hypothetical protein AAFZ07_27880 [Actinomycetota bacterium]
MSDTAAPATPCLAHYGATLAEDPLSDDELHSAPPLGAAADALAFLDFLGFVPLIENRYPSLGRQWILGRGDRSEPAYLERDVFTSFTAGTVDSAAGDHPAVGDTIVRLPLADPAGTVAELSGRGWATPYAPEPAWFRGPDGMVYEPAPIDADPGVNRMISIWTDPAEVDRISRDYQVLFAFEEIAVDEPVGTAARATVLRRSGVGPVTLRLLTPGPRAATVVAPRVTDDIFAQVGYAHFRLGAPDREAVRAAGTEVFPDTGDVSYVLFQRLPRGRRADPERLSRAP